ncbi:MAG: hypothetical protein R3B54_09630 [Bdellovibrionota bacterium]
MFVGVLLVLCVSVSTGSAEKAAGEVDKEAEKLQNADLLEELGHVLA